LPSSYVAYVADFFPNNFDGYQRPAATLRNIDATDCVAGAARRIAVNIGKLPELIVGEAMRHSGISPSCQAKNNSPPSCAPFRC